MPPPTSKPKPTSKIPTTVRLLQRVHPPSTARAIHSDKIQHKPLQLHPAADSHTSTSPATKDAREARRASRAARLLSQHRRRRTKPHPLSAADKRRLCIYDIPRAERKYERYVGLWRLWCGYMREILLGWAPEPEETEAYGEDGSSEKVPRPQFQPTHNDTGERLRRAHVETQQAGAKLAAADFHGALLEVVRCRCVSRVGVSGIVVKDTMFTFEVVTQANEIKTLPKEGTVFRFRVPLVDELEKDVEHEGKESSGAENEALMESKSLVFELHGEEFKFRAPDRANKKFRWHLSKDYT